MRVVIYRGALTSQHTALVLGLAWLHHHYPKCVTALCRNVIGQRIIAFRHYPAPYLLANLYVKQRNVSHLSEMFVPLIQLLSVSLFLMTGASWRAPLYSGFLSFLGVFVTTRATESLSILTDARI